MDKLECCQKYDILGALVTSFADAGIKLDTKIEKLIIHLQGCLEPSHHRNSYDIFVR